MDYKTAAPLHDTGFRHIHNGKSYLLMANDIFEGAVFNLGPMFDEETLQPVPFEAQSAIFIDLCNEQNALYYARSREDFDMDEAVEKFSNTNHQYLFVENLS